MSPVVPGLFLQAVLQINELDYLVTVLYPFATKIRTCTQVFF